MKKKISLNMWLSVFFGGIWQFICNIFSWKNKTPFWRVIWAVITVCIVINTCILSYLFYKAEFKSDDWEYDEDLALSEDFNFRDNGLNSGDSYIYNLRTKKKVIKGIDWILFAADADSLFVVAKDGKRGFVDRYTGEVSIPFKYDEAWLFTDGVAGVCEGDSIYFIDRSGKPINDKKFRRVRDYDNDYGYRYYGKYAVIPVADKYGLVDRDGDWALPPEYEEIEISPNDLWKVTAGGKQGVMDADGCFVLPVAYKSIWVHTDNGIVVTNDDNSLSRYGYDGSLIDKFVFDNVEYLSCYIDEFDERGNQKLAADNNMLRYSADDYYGLMTPDGKPVTAPLYSSIEYVSPGVYQCMIPGTYESIMVNAKGEKINY